MNLNRKEPVILLFGDLVALFCSLWLMLFLRYLELPERDLIEAHLRPFFLLFLVWIFVFFIAGLYEKHTLLLRSRVRGMLTNAQIVNSAIAFVFFYLVSSFGIAPKTNLFLFLLISLALIALWRFLLFPRLAVPKKEGVLLVGTGDEMQELHEELQGNPRYGLRALSSIDLAEEEEKEKVIQALSSDASSLAIIDFHDSRLASLLPNLSSFLSHNVRFVDMHKVYEDVFDRIPLSLVEYSWFLEHLSGSARKGYDIVKRLMDLLIAFLLGIGALLLTPFVALAIVLEDRGPVFFRQERVGRGGRRIRIIKFRSMAVHTNSDGVAKDPRPTHVGKFLRATRIDELPQLWNVLKGDLSLIGPRPEVPSLASVYERDIPFYGIRHLITPGLSGWAQLYQEAPPKFSAELNQTRTKLSYDLYYLKNRSFLLDCKIALRTLKVILSREGI